MGICSLNSIDTVRELLGVAQACDEPVIVLDGEEECLVAMRPAVFERILFDSDLLNSVSREAMQF